MKSDKELYDICLKIWHEQFAKADPPRDLHDVIRTGEGRKPNWFEKYYLAQDEQNKIMERHIKRHRLEKHDAERVRTTVILGCAPSCNPDEKERKRMMKNYGK